MAETVTMAVARQAPRNGFFWMWSSILPIERSSIPVGIRASAAPPVSRPPPSRPVPILTAGARPARYRPGFTRVTTRPVEGSPAGRIYGRATSLGAARARGAASEVSS